MAFVVGDVDDPASGDVFGGDSGCAEGGFGEGGDDRCGDPGCAGADFDVFGFPLGGQDLLQGVGVVAVDGVGGGSFEGAGEFGADVARQRGDGGNEFVGVIEAGIDQAGDEVAGVGGAALPAGRR